MTEFTIIDEQPVTLADTKVKIDLLAEEGELTFRAEKTKSYLENFVRLSKEETDAIRSEIEGLEIPRIKDRHIVKILDVMPKDLDSIKMILSGETLTINDDDLKKILDVIPQ
jgi:DNA-directed RNA polymerase subunit F